MTTTTTPARDATSWRPGLGWFVGAAALGVAHAIPSAYWALGGTALVETVGAVAEEFQRADPLVAGAMLGAVALGKLAAALIPLWSEARRPRSRPFWRVVSWIGGVGLVLWALYGMSGAALQLLGVLVPSSGVDVAGALGHLLLWDPLFLAWGASLLVGLWRSRAGRSRDGRAGYGLRMRGPSGERVTSAQ